MATQFGYTVVVNEEFPVDNTDFTAAIQKAKTSGADILFVDSVTPQGISLRKQMAAVGWTPKVMVNEKGAEPVQYAQALADLADGVLVGAYWDPSFPYPGAKDLQQAFEKETGRHPASTSPTATPPPRCYSTPSPQPVPPTRRKSTTPSRRPTRPTLSVP